MNKLKKLSKEAVVSFSAMVVSICALSVAVFEARLMQDAQQEQRVYQRASVWPNLAFQVDSDNDAIRLYLNSNGLGLAKLQSFSIAVDDKPMTGWNQAIETLYGHSKDLSQHRNIINGQVIPAGSSIKLMTIKDKNFFTVAHDRLDVKACYCSVYNQCWEQAGFAQGKPVQSCPAPSN